MKLTANRNVFSDREEAKTTTEMKDAFIINALLIKSEFSSLSYMEPVLLVFALESQALIKGFCKRKLQSEDLRQHALACKNPQFSKLTDCWF